MSLKPFTQSKAFLVNVELFILIKWQELSCQDGNYTGKMFCCCFVLCCFVMGRRWRWQRNIWSVDWLQQRHQLSAYNTVLKELNIEDSSAYGNYQWMALDDKGNVKVSSRKCKCFLHSDCLITSKCDEKYDRVLYQSFL